MWFVFPQVAGLGSSMTSIKYAIPSLADAGQYLSHAILGPRPIATTNEVLRHADTSLVDIFGSIDAKKFRSSMTLFREVPQSDPIFQHALDVFCHADADPRTLEILAAQK